MKNPKLVIGIIAIVVLLIIFFIVFSNSKKTVVTKSGTSVQQAGFFDSLMALLQPKGTSTNSGTSKGGGLASAWCAVFPKSKGCQPASNCDPNKIGWNLQGFPDTNCNFG